MAQPHPDKWHRFFILGCGTLPGVWYKLTHVEGTSFSCEVQVLKCVEQVPRWSVPNLRHAVNIFRYVWGRFLGVQYKNLYKLDTLKYVV